MNPKSGQTVTIVSADGKQSCERVIQEVGKNVLYFTSPLPEWVAVGCEIHLTEKKG